jgi:hypothetical protein
MSSFPGERCQHIKISGDRCGAPALHERDFCRFHDCCGSRELEISTSAAHPAAFFYLPTLEDAASIQATITQVCEHLLHRRLDPKKAGVMLYAMQVASSNLDRLSRENTDQENAQRRAQEFSSSVPASPEAISTAHDVSAPIPPGKPDRLPPGTIQASAQPRRRTDRIKMG